MASSSQVTAALIEHKLFDQSIVGIFPHDYRWLHYDVRAGYCYERESEGAIHEFIRQVYGF